VITQASIPKPDVAPTPETSSQKGVPVVHTQGRDRRRENLKVVIPTPVHEPEPQRETPVPKTSSLKKGIDYITEEEAKRWVNPNARNLGEHYKTWGARLYK